jgi:ABC-type transport system substrate-binding protein
LLLILILILAAAQDLAAAAAAGTPPAPSPAGVPPTLTILGFAAGRAPGNALPCRQAFAHAVDRQAVAAAVAPHLPRPAFPARSIQHPALPRVNPAPFTYEFDPARARALFAECGFAGTLRVLSAGGGARALAAHDDAAAESFRRALNTRVEVDRVATVELALFTARTGSAAVWLLPWVPDPRQFGHPSFALGIGAALVTDPEVRALVAKDDALGAEDLMLRRAWIIPVIYY